LLIRFSSSPTAPGSSPGRGVNDLKQLAIGH
jgi:hypothetical protein